MAMSSVSLFCWFMLAISASAQSNRDHAQYVPDPGTFFMLQNMVTGKCIDVSGRPGVSNSANIQVWDCEDPRSSITDQVWRRESNGRLVNRASRKCMDVRGYRVQTLRANIQLYYCEDPNYALTDHVWDFYYDDSRRFVQLRNRYTGRCLDVQGYAVAGRPHNIQQFVCETEYNVDTDQWWRVVEV